MRMHDGRAFEDARRARRNERHRRVVRHAFQKGHQVRTITAFTNDPNNSQVAMTMQGIVKKQVEAVPGEVAFGEVKRGTEGTKEVLINDLNPARGEFSVGPISNSNDAIKVEQEKR